jgi:hypothetical protein
MGDSPPFAAWPWRRLRIPVELLTEFGGLTVLKTSVMTSTHSEACKPFCVDACTQTSALSECSALGEDVDLRPFVGGLRLGPIT